MINRSGGVLLHISSLPGKYGIGNFGKEAVEFSKLLKDMGMSYWQTLPFSTTDKCNSPYKSFSAFAGNPYFINLEILAEKGLLTQEELKENENPNPYFVDFNWLETSREKVFHKAYRRIDENYKKLIYDFCEKNIHWLPDYALYMTLREKAGGKDWYDWEDKGLKFHEREAVAEAMIQYAEDVLYHEFLQFEFYSQWAQTKKEINEQGIKMIGDMPIYVSLESSDVWASRELFSLSEDGSPKLVAGVPPDYFSEEGQLWGNPLYNWELMKEENYKWWTARIENSLKIFDMVRIDHFRGFSAYWAVPFGASTAKSGSWVKGPGMDFFNVIMKKFNSSQIIAEDLGDIDEDVCKLLEETKLPGMRVMQFAFIGDKDSIHLPHNYEKNVIAYTGTHDNNTILGWLWEASEENRQTALEYCNFTGKDWGEGGYYSEPCRAVIRTLWQSTASLTIVPIQDLCGFGSDTKMNKPGIAEGNWAFRITEEALSNIDKKYYRDLNRIYRRGI